MDATTIPLETAEALCLHCGQSVPSYRSEFCCAGCQTVYGLLHSTGLEKFYTLKPKKILPLLNYFSRREDLGWVEKLEGLSQGKVLLHIEGIQCAACVWAIGELGRRLGPARVEVEAPLGLLRLFFDPQTFDLKNYLSILQNLGYHTSAADKDRQTRSSPDLLLRLGVCAAIAMNTMFLSISAYLGMGKSDPLLYDLFSRLDFYLSFISVSVGGSYFIGRAFKSLQHGMLHFDLPIAIGLLAAFTGSVAAYFLHHPENSYFDTVNIFIALMLAGRYAQERFLQKNRHALLAEPDLGHLETTRLSKTIEDIRFDEVKTGDRLLIQPGGILPVESTLDFFEAEFSLAWISGEAVPVLYQQKEKVPAGAHLVSAEAIEVTATTDYQSSSLTTLSPVGPCDQQLPFVWEWVTKRYVWLVLISSLSGLILWLFINPAKALTVFTSILVVTCPCSLGIAIPLARSLANKALLTRGLFARDGALLDKSAHIRHIVFDKTGTLTLAALSIENPRVFNDLSKQDLILLYNAVARSRHPASQALYQHLKGMSLGQLPIQVREVTGQGLQVTFQGEKYFIGRSAQPSHTSSSSTDYEVDFWHDETLLARFFLKECLVEDAASTMAVLKKAGFDLRLLSGDKPERVLNMASRLGIKPENAVASCTPQDKAAIVAKLGPGTLMLGDGLNDSQAFGQATLSGAPVWERSILAQSASFFYVAGTLQWLPDLFKISKIFIKTVTLNVRFSLIYNLGVISLCLAGLMSPLWAAILMPSGSIAIVGLTFRRMRSASL